MTPRLDSQQSRIDSKIGVQLCLAKPLKTTDFIADFISEFYLRTYLQNSIEETSELRPSNPWMIDA